MSELQIAWLELGTVGGLGVLLTITGVMIHIISKKKNRLCTAQTSGVVINYDLSTRNGMYPVVEYTVGGNVYQAKRKFRNVIMIRFSGFPVKPKAYEDEKGVLHIKIGAAANLRELAEQLWPAGSRMAVYYNPDRPEICYIQRPVSGGVTAAIFIIMGLVTILLSALVFFLMQL